MPCHTPLLVTSTTGDAPLFFSLTTKGLLYNYRLFRPYPVLKIYDLETRCHALVISSTTFSSHIRHMVLTTRLD